MSARRLLSAAVAAIFSLGLAGAAEAQLWKPKKKPAAAATKKKPVRKAARKKPVRKKRGGSSSVVKFGPPPNHDDEDVAPDDTARIDRDARHSDDPDDDVDDNPRISVYDGDRDE